MAAERSGFSSGLGRAACSLAGADSGALFSAAALGGEAAGGLVAGGAALPWVVLPLGCV